MIRRFNKRSSMLLVSLVAGTAALTTGCLGEAADDPIVSTKVDAGHEQDAGMVVTSTIVPPQACKIDDDCGENRVCIVALGQCAWDADCNNRPAEDKSCGEQGICLSSGLCISPPGMNGTDGQPGTPGMDGMNGCSIVTRTSTNAETCLWRECPGVATTFLECIAHPAGCFTATASVADRTGCFITECPPSPPIGPICDGRDGASGASCQFTTVTGSTQSCLFRQCANEQVPTRLLCTQNVACTASTYTSSTTGQQCSRISCPQQANPVESCSQNCTFRQDGNCIESTCISGSGPTQTSTTSRYCPNVSCGPITSTTRTSSTTGRSELCWEQLCEYPSRSEVNTQCTPLPHPCDSCAAGTMCVNNRCEAVMTDAGVCPVGDLTCACYANSTCNGSLSCVSGVCVNLPSGDAGVVNNDAGTCANGTEGCSCFGNNTCNAGLTCASSLCVVVTTDAGVAPDASSCPGGTGCACVDDSNCLNALRCGTLNLCEPRPGNPDASVPPDSGTCTNGTEGCTCYGNGSCNAGLTCASNLCVAIPDSGMTCPNGTDGCDCYGNNTCNAGLTCTSGTCGPTPPPADAGVAMDASAPDATTPGDSGVGGQDATAGDASCPNGTDGCGCYGNNTCNVGLTCNTTSGTCGPTPPPADAGVAMDASAPMDSGVVADSGVIVDAGPCGGPCPSGRVCVNNACILPTLQATFTWTSTGGDAPPPTSVVRMQFSYGCYGAGSTVRAYSQVGGQLAVSAGASLVLNQVVQGDLQSGFICELNAEMSDANGLPAPSVDERFAVGHVGLTFRAIGSVRADVSDGREIMCAPFERAPGAGGNWRCVF